MLRLSTVFGVALAAWIAAMAAAYAGLRYQADQTPDGLRYVMVIGEFSLEDNLDEFASVVRSHNPTVIGFNSNGGNIGKAMELGRLIRSYRLGTFQPRGPECSSACALAFLGGVMRFAEPGAIGVHKSSFSGDVSLSAQEAVSAVQQITADVISYMLEMGVDPSLLQLSLKYESNDIRYLSRSEMEQYRVTTYQVDTGQPQISPPTAPPAAPQPSVAAAPAPSIQNDWPLSSIPEARSGRVRHPKGAAPIKALPDGKSANLVNLANGSPVAILDDADRWYRVQSGSQTGYMHHTWVFVDQYDSGPFGQRHIQIKSFDNLAEANAYARSASIAVSAYLVTNGWFAITLEKTYDEQMARNLVALLKKNGAIPDDAFMTYGNTYVRKVCCQ
ncbi:MAG TPA: hypothetical protein VGX71_10320 [Pseudaminobacter sp.]|nr:hypothetical protein [Pseudaminobacter sp.]